MASQKHKSNKTAHVLNLLASNAPEEEEAPSSTAAGEADSQPAKTESSKKSEEVPVAPTGADTPASIPIVTPLGETGDPLDAVIQGNLELELAADLKEQENQPAAAEKPKFIPGFPAGFVPPEPAVAEPPKPDAPKAKETASPAVQQEERTEAPVPTQQEIQAGAGTAASPSQQQFQEVAPATSSQRTTQVSAPELASTEQEAAAPSHAPDAHGQVIQTPPSAPEPKKPEPAYQYINVMEHLVDGRVLEAMRMFDMCTCERCQIDVKALALTYLMPKYIVVDRGYSSPLLNFYSNKFSTDTMTQLTKACTIVQKYPRH